MNRGDIQKNVVEKISHPNFYIRKDANTARTKLPVRKSNTEQMFSFLFEITDCCTASYAINPNQVRTK